MNRFKLIIPLVVFIISLLSGLIYSSSKSARLESLINEAALENKPVIYVDYCFRHLNSLVAYDLSGREAPVMNNTDPMVYTGINPIVAPDGNLHFWIYPKFGNFRQLWMVDIPGTRPRMIDLINRGEYVRWRGKILVCGNDPLWRFREIENELYIYNYLNSDRVKINSQSALPWNEITYTHRAYISLNVTPEGEYAYAVGSFGRVSSSSYQAYIWRYDISNDTWTTLHHGSNLIGISTGPGGDMLGCINLTMTQCDVKFLDGHTGDELHVVQNAINPVIGRRWAACLDISNSPNSFKIKVFDIDNDWEEYEIDFSEDLPLRYSHSLNSAFSLSIYEP